MSLMGTLFKFSSGPAAKRFEKATLAPAEVQHDLLMGMLRRNAGTEYGKRHGFEKIRSVEDYRSAVPIVDYEQIRADMTRVTEGESNIFTAEDPVSFAQTSGTTGTPKYVPVTPTCQGAPHKDIMKTWLNHAARAHRDIFAAKIISLVSPAVEGYAPSGVPFGSTSGTIYRDQSWLARQAYAIPYDVFEIADYEAKYYAIMRISVAQDVRFLCTANPSSIIKMCQKADEHAEAIIKDINDGTLSDAFRFEPEIRAALQRSLKPNAARARELDSFRKRRNGALLPGDFWSHLSLIGCWKGGTVGHYIDRFPALFDPDDERPVATRDWGYLSSEVRGSIPLSDEGSQGVLTIASNYFEFVQVDELLANRDAPERWTYLGAHEVVEDEEYYIFITTSGGLYRYDINDIIKVTGRYNGCPQIVFMRKGRGMTNITGEKLSVNQVMAGVEQAAQVTGFTPDHYKVEANVEKARYILRVEFTMPQDEAGSRRFLREFDDALKTINIEYKSKRDSQRLMGPELHMMRPGWYERGRRKQADAGNRVFQAKSEILTDLHQATALIAPELLGRYALED